jgi:hypothetical protein
MLKGDIRKFGHVQGGDLLPPELARFHDIGLLAGGHAVAALARQFKGDSANACDFIR